MLPPIQNEKKCVFQTQPVKLYIQDIYRAKRCETNKFIYELFGMSFKNIMIHGVVTSITKNTLSSAIIEVTDPTGSTQVNYDCTKNNYYINMPTMNNLAREFKQYLACNDNIAIVRSLFNSIANQKIDDFKEGCCISVIGDIYVDEVNVRRVSAFECHITSVEREIVWLEELKYMYEKYYFKELVR